ncbi:ribonuclease D [Nevskia sp.]|uniref:ribonuclease D n=1 Tax=Nevskia sp. TaxID=1929292 RepID=UPI0025D4628E|nr:ribonuclease D [Nevskia sp.]
MNPGYELITTPDALAARIDGWKQRPWLALDTEFLREDTYHPILCLVQVGDGESDVCIDTLAFAPEALTPLWALFADPAITKVFHAPSQDLEIFVRLGGTAATPFFDTQIAAAMLGLGDQLGYAALVEKMTGIKLDKSLTRTDWSRRPLTGPELAYAAADVRHLSDIHPRLREDLAAKGRLHWLEEDCARLAEPSRYRNPPDDAWKRLKGLARLAPTSQPIAIALAGWRERIAQERDRPRKWIIDDDALYRIAERAPRDLDELAALKVLPPKTLERHGAALTALVTEARTSIAPALTLDEPLDDAQKALLKRLQDGLRGIADALGVPASLIAPRADLELLVRVGASADAAVLSGWRRDVAGEALLSIL